MTDDRVHALDPIFAIPESRRGKEFQPIDHSAEEHNRWRARQSEYCWLCANFDRCNLGHKCRHQVDIDILAQHPRKR